MVDVIRYIKYKKKSSKILMMVNSPNNKINTQGVLLSGKYHQRFFPAFNLLSFL